MSTRSRRETAPGGRAPTRARARLIFALALLVGPVLAALAGLGAATSPPTSAPTPGAGAGATAGTPSSNAAPKPAPAPSSSAAAPPAAAPPTAEAGSKSLVQPAAGATPELVAPVEAAYKNVKGPPLDEMSFPLVKPREEVEKSNQDLVEILEGFPGVAVIESGGDEGPWAVSIRGGGEKRAAVYLDGVLLNDPMGTAPDLSLLPVDQIEQVVVYRGTTPPGYPAAGPGGVIDVKTREAQNRKTYHLRAAYDTFDVAQAGAAATGEVLGGAAAIGNSNHWGAADHDFENQNGTPKDRRDDFPDQRRPNAFEKHDVLMKWERKIGEYRVYAGGFYQVHHRDLQAEEFLPAKQARAGGDLAIVDLGFKAPALIDANLDAEVRLHYLTENRWTKDQRGELGPPRDDALAWRRLGLDGYFYYYGLPANRLALYLGLSEENFQPESHLDPDLNQVSADRRSFHLGFADELTLVEDTIKIKPRFRWVQSHTDYQGPTLTRQQNPGFDAISHSAADADVSLSYIIAKSFWIVLNGGQSFRLPDFTEEYGDRDLHLGDPNLAPERHDKWEFSLVYLPEPGAVWRFDTVRAEFSIYQDQVHDAIGWIDDGTSTLRADNVGDARVNGLELELKLNLRDLLLIEAAYSYQDPINLAYDPNLYHHDLPGLARNSASVNATIYGQYGRLYYKGLYQDLRFLDDANHFQERPRFVHNVGFGYYLGRWTFGLEAQNLGDNQSRERLYYPLPGARYLFVVEANSD